jgi:glycine cleavage system regulatory protein
MRTVTVTVRSKDRIGLVNEIAGVIARMGLHIIESNARTYMNRRTSKPESEFCAVLGFEETVQQEILLARLRKIRGCLEVSVKSCNRIAA